MSQSFFPSSRRGVALLCRLLSSCLLALSLAAHAQAPGGAPADLSRLKTGHDIFQAACQACHGPDGRGQPQSQVGFDIPLPDFTDCDYASREAVHDWVGIAHEGGPVRGFKQMMPAFGKALSEEQLTKAVEYIHSFCKDPAWPRGDFNLPRPLVTGKAWLEDELVLTSGLATEGDKVQSNTLTWEKRVGKRSQFEVGVPFGWNQGDKGTRLGDITTEFKHVMYDSLDRGTIVSLAGEFAFPTGDAASGFGTDTTIFEPNVMVGKILPGNFFAHGQFGFEFPFDTAKADNEMYLNTALGTTFEQANWGRAWSPIIEVLGARELAGGSTDWDVVPQLNITLSQRQHVQLGIGARIPITNSGPRSTEYLMYFMWDWYDGGLLEAW